ncbi:MAG: hypothetical protein ACYC1H_06425, partial [Rectinema subterraneum]
LDKPRLLEPKQFLIQFSVLHGFSMAETPCFVTVPIGFTEEPNVYWLGRFTGIFACVLFM